MERGANLVGFDVAVKEARNVDVEHWRLWLASMAEDIYNHVFGRSEAIKRGDWVFPYCVVEEIKQWKTVVVVFGRDVEAEGVSYWFSVRRNGEFKAGANFWGGKIAVEGRLAGVEG